MYPSLPKTTRFAHLELTTVSLELTIGQLANNISCQLCKASFDARLVEVLMAWAAVPVNLVLSGTDIGGR